MDFTLINSKELATHILKWFEQNKKKFNDPNFWIRDATAKIIKQELNKINRWKVAARGNIDKARLNPNFGQLNNLKPKPAKTNENNQKQPETKENDLNW